MADQLSRPQGLWWRRHHSLAVAAGAALLLAIGGVALEWHVATTASDPSSVHAAAGDFVFFGMLAGLVVLMAGLVIARGWGKSPEGSVKGTTRS